MKRRKNQKTAPGAWFTIAMLWLFSLALGTSFAISLATGKYFPANPRVSQERFLRSESPRHYWSLVGFTGAMSLLLGGGAGYLTFRRARDRFPNHPQSAGPARRPQA